jgi:hypothetical protein
MQFTCLSSDCSLYFTWYSVQMRASFVNPGLAVQLHCLTALVAVLIWMLLELFASVRMVICLHLLVMTSF